MIRHTVVFRLKHAKGSDGESAFFKASESLASLPTVKNFERLRQISPKNDYSFGFAMAFDDQAAYDAYSAHPVHVAYLRDIWIPNVAAFMEIDTVAF